MPPLPLIISGEKGYYPFWLNLPVAGCQIETGQGQRSLVGQGIFSFVRKR